MKLLNKKISDSVLILCPPNMTVPHNGPNGFLGDRVHQLPAILKARELYSDVFVWPEDSITKELFFYSQIKLIKTEDTNEVINFSNNLKINTVVCLYSDPINCPPERIKDIEVLLKCHKIATKLSKNNLIIPAELDPKGQIPIWKILLSTIFPEVKKNLKWNSPPFIKPRKNVHNWGLKTVREIADKKPIIIISPFSGTPRKIIDKPWWRELAKIFKSGKIIVPVHESEINKAKSIFDGFDNVTVISTNIEETAALASVEGVHVLGIDGGRMNVLAASTSRGVLGIYDTWPASAWAFPNVVSRNGDITQEEALMIVP